MKTVETNLSYERFIEIVVKKDNVFSNTQTVLWGLEIYKTCIDNPPKPWPTQDMVVAINRIMEEISNSPNGDTLLNLTYQPFGADFKYLFPVRVKWSTKKHMEKALFCLMHVQKIPADGQNKAVFLNGESHTDTARAV